VLFDYNPDVDGASSGDEYDSGKDQSSDKSSFISLPDSEDAIRLDYYVSHQGIISSDHKPLDAGFTLTFESVIPQLKSKVHQDVIRDFDKAENESRPGLTVVVDYYGDEPEDSKSDDPNSVNFGSLAFNVPMTRSLTVANTSGVPATFSFDNPGQEGGAYHKTPSWLTLHVDQRGDSEREHKKATSQERTLFPGELAHVEIRALVQDIEQVRLLNSGQLKLEEILVLRVTSGRDHFISVFGKWLPTCFGRSVDELTRLPEAGARSLADPEAAKAAEQDTGVRLSAPRELFRLTEAIAELTVRAVAEWSMTTGGPEQESPPWMAEPHGTGWPFIPETWTLKHGEGRAPLLVSVREALDTNQPLTAALPLEVPSLHRLEVLCETLQVFLHSLSDGIVASSVWHNLEEQILAREKSKTPPRSWEETQAWVLENLAYSPAHSVSFTFVTFMLARIVNEVAPASSLATRQASQKSSEEQRSPEGEQGSGPSPASTAAFISGASFRRTQRSDTTSSSSAGNSGPAVARRATVEAALATRFANFLIAMDTPLPNKERDRRALEDRKRSVIEPFLKTIGVDDDGPSGGAR
jgi:phosphatidylinositol-bisphosphatase